MIYIIPVFRERLTRYGFVKPAHLVFTLCVLCVLCGKTPAQDFKQVHPGVEYAQVERKLGGDPVKINLLKLDLTKVRLDVHHALDRAIGLETTSSIAKRKNAVAAINAGFFRLDKSQWAGESAGVLVVDQQIYSEAFSNRISMVIVNNKKATQQVIFQHLDIFPVVLVNQSDGSLKVGVNRERKADEIVLFSPIFGQSTKTQSVGLELLLSDCKQDICRNLEFRDGYDSPIPSNGYVLSIGPEFVERNRELIAKLRAPGSVDRLRVQANIRRDFLSKLFSYELDITNGVPQLIKNGKIDITWEQEKASKSFVETRHPRTAVAKLKDGKFLMMTVDGRQPGVSVGMTLQELAEYLLSLGAVDAMNLDGGGSTTMFLDGKVVNTPSDKEGERKIGDAIVVTLRNPKK